MSGGEWSAKRVGVWAKRGRGIYDSPVSSTSAVRLSEPRTWLAPVILGLVGSILLSGLGFAILTSIVGREDLVSSNVGAGLGEAAQRVATDQPTSWDRWPISFTAILQIPLWVGLLGPAMWEVRRRGHKLSELFDWRFTPADLILGLGIGAALQFALPFAYGLAFEIFGERDVGAPARELASRADGLGILLLVLITVIGAPIIEETFFRGLLQPFAAAWMPQWLAIVVTSLVFGLFHFQVLQFPALFVFALVVGGFAAHLGRLGRSIWIHIGFNATSITTLLLTT